MIKVVLIVLEGFHHATIRTLNQRSPLIWSPRITYQRSSDGKEVIMRVTRRAEVEHHITMPRHKATLSNIPTDVAEHLRIDKEELIRKLWD